MHPEKFSSFEEGEKKLSADYENIRNEATEILQRKILLLEEKLSEGKNPEVVKLEEGLKKLQANQFVLETAEKKNWQKTRDYSQDLEITDRDLAKELAEAALSH